MQYWLLEEVHDISRAGRDFEWAQAVCIHWVCVLYILGLPYYGS